MQNTAAMPQAVAAPSAVAIHIYEPKVEAPVGQQSPVQSQLQGPTQDTFVKSSQAEQTQQK